MKRLRIIKEVMILLMKKIDDNLNKRLKSNNSEESSTSNIEVKSLVMY